MNGARSIEGLFQTEQNPSEAAPRKKAQQGEFANQFLALLFDEIPARSSSSTQRPGTNRDGQVKAGRGDKSSDRSPEANPGSGGKWSPRFGLHQGEAGDGTDQADPKETDRASEGRAVRTESQDAARPDIGNAADPPRNSTAHPASSHRSPKPSGQQQNRDLIPRFEPEPGRLADSKPAGQARPGLRNPDLEKRPSVVDRHSTGARATHGTSLAERLVTPHELRSVDQGEKADSTRLDGDGKRRDSNGRNETAVAKSALDLSVAPASKPSRASRQASRTPEDVTVMLDRESETAREVLGTGPEKSRSRLAESRGNADSSPKQSADQGRNYGQDLDHASRNEVRDSSDKRAEQHSLSRSGKVETGSSSTGPARPGPASATSHSGGDSHWIPGATVRVEHSAAGARVSGGHVRTSSGEANPDRIFDQIVQTTKLERQNGMDRFTVNLKPGFLGRIEIETDIRSDEGVHAVIRVEDPAVKKAVEKGLADLLDQLGDLGVDIDSAEVSDFQASEQERNGEQSTAPSSNRLRNRNSAGVAIDDPESTGAAGNDSGVFSYFA